MVESTPGKTGATQPRWLTRGVLGIGLSSFFSDAGHEAATSLLPVLLASVGAPAFALGVIEGVADGLSSFAKLAGGWIADRVAWRKPVAAGGYLVVALSTFAYGLARSWPMLLALRAFGWMGRGAKGPSRDALLSDGVPAESVGRAFGFERAMDTLGAVAGPLLATTLVGYLSVPAALRWTLVPGMLATLAFSLLVPAERQPTHHQRLAFSESVRRLPRAFHRFLGAVFVFGLGDFAHSLLILRAAQILTTHYGLLRAGSLGVALYTLHNLVYALTSYPAGALGDRFGRRGVLALGYALAGLMNLGFMLGPHGIVPLALLFVLGGMYVGIQDALEKAVATQLLPGEIRGMGYGVLATVNGVGDFVSSIAVGFLWSGLRPAAGFLYAAVLTVTGAVLMYRRR